MSTKLLLASLRLDGGTQPRVNISKPLIGEYAEAMKAGDEFPPLTAFDDGENKWLVDGFHRAAAYRVCGTTHVRVDTRKGSKHDALLFSCSANASHGQRRTNDDKRRAVLLMLRHVTWENLSDREIAKHCLVSPDLVGSCRREISVGLTQTAPAKRTVKRGGTTYDMDTAAGPAKRKTARDAAKEAEPPPGIETSHLIAAIRELEMYTNHPAMEVARVAEDPAKLRDESIAVRDWLNGLIEALNTPH